MIKNAIYIITILWAFGAQAQSVMQSNFRSTDGYFTANVPGGWLTDLLPFEGYRLVRMKDSVGMLTLKSYKRFDDSTRAIQFIIDKTDGHGGVRSSWVGDKEYTRYNFSVQMEGRESNTSVTIVRKGHRLVIAYYAAPRVVRQQRYWQTEVNEVNMIIASIDFP